MFQRKVIDWAEWENLTSEQFQKKWDKLDFKEKQYFLYEHIAIVDPVEFHGTEPGQKLLISFFTKANQQAYWTNYIPDTDEFAFWLHGKKVNIDNRIPRIKEKLMEKIGKEYGN
jgi:hypothetical protein